MGEYRMAEEDALKPDEKWALKDAMIAIPFLGSALALTWEVGYFLRIRGGAFNLFSISEHISFALQALPFALAFSVVIMLWVFVPKDVAGIRRHAFESGRRTSIATGMILASGIYAVLLYYVYHSIYLVTWVGCAVGMIWLVIELFSPKPVDKWAMALLSATAVFGFTMALGFDIANSEVNSAKSLSAIRFGEGELQIRVLRTGERGVLYFDPAQKKFGLAPWDSVKKIDWETGLFPR
jgi:hypothetical protein